MVACEHPRLYLDTGKTSEDQRRNLRGRYSPESLGIISPDDQFKPFQLLYSYWLTKASYRHECTGVFQGLCRKTYISNRQNGLLQRLLTTLGILGVADIR